MRLGDFLDGRVFQQERGVLGLLHIQLEERLWAKRRVCGNSDTLILRQLDKSGLREIWVMLDLEGGRLDLGIPKEIHDQLSVEVADANALGKTILGQALHRGPRLLDGGVPGHDFLAVIGEAGRVPYGRVDVFQRDGEVHDVQVKVVDAPVAELFLADGLDTLAIVERIPQLGHDEEVLALDDAFLNGASYTLAGLDLIAIILFQGQLGIEDCGQTSYLPHAPSKSRYPDLMALYTWSAQVSLLTFQRPKPTMGI